MAADRNVRATDDSVGYVARTFRSAIPARSAIARLCVFAADGDTRAAFGAAGIRRFCDEGGLAAREAVPAPGTVARAGVASPTRSPWIDANGWRFTRHPGRTFLYDTLPAGKAALAAAEAYAYGADAALKIDPKDAPALAAMLTFLDQLPAVDLPAVADLAVVDDGSAASGEVMNLLTRRNLLFAVLPSASPRFRINIALGSAQYPVAEAADPSAFVLRIRRELTDDARTLRVFGSEVVIGRLTGDGRRARLHLVNYGGREIEGLRIRLRGGYGPGEAQVAGAGRLPLRDHAAADGATEFTVPKLGTYAVIDLASAR